MDGGAENARFVGGCSEGKGVAPFPCITLLPLFLQLLLNLVWKLLESLKELGVEQVERIFKRILKLTIFI